MPEQQTDLAQPQMPVELKEEQTPATPQDGSMSGAAMMALEGEEDLNTLDDLEEIEFLLDEIEDQIAPLAL